MKKLLMVLAFAGVSVAGMAQSNESNTPEMKYSVATNSFWSNWFVQANLSASAFYSNEEYGRNLSLRPWKGFRNNLGLSVAVGKWFTPGLGLRTKLNGFWGRSIISDDSKTNANKYWTLNEQVLFNLSNLFYGYNETRIWNLIPYAGAGLSRNMSYNKYAFGLSAGILNTFRINDKLAANVELAYGIFSPDFSGITEQRIQKGGINKLKNKDHQFSLEVGLTYNLGKTRWNKTPDVDAIKALSQGQIDALNAQLSDAQAENTKLKSIAHEAEQKVAAAKAEAESKTVKEVVSAPVSVFFNIGKSTVASKKDLQNVKELAEIAKDNNSKIVVTGYADSKTGSKAFNQRLSQKRAETVANELVKMGVSRDNIEIVAAGGVNTLSPVSYNRRATVALK